ncbi:hypothetical protein, partial [Klebsiella pneumoniae]|uniref:hypothetical protein n=1 Tax=Klebsiella pneumoniae TaxID=573 RepID=UPI001C54B812
MDYIVRVHPAPSFYLYWIPRGQLTNLINGVTGAQLREPGHYSSSCNRDCSAGIQSWFSMDYIV